MGRKGGSTYKEGGKGGEGRGRSIYNQDKFKVN